MDETGTHHSQQADTRMENQTLHVLIHKWVLNNEDTGRGISHIGAWGAGRGLKLREESSRWEDWGGIALGEIPNVDERAMDAANHHHGTYIPM